jgi:hypothetical protein
MCTELTPDKAALFLLLFIHVLGIFNIEFGIQNGFDTSACSCDKMAVVSCAGIMLRPDYYSGPLKEERPVFYCSSKVEVGT